MRVIYLVRAAQLLVTLCTLSTLYSVSEFCEQTHHSEESCGKNQEQSAVPSNVIVLAWRHSTPEENADLERRNKERGWKPNVTRVFPPGIRMATPEEMAALERHNEERAQQADTTAEKSVKDDSVLPPGARWSTEEENAALFGRNEERAQQANTTSSSSSSSTGAATTTTAHESTSTESSTVTLVTSTEDEAIRRKRGVEEEARELPDNGATEAKRKTSVGGEKKEDSSSQQEEAKEETKKPEKNPYHLLAQRTKKTEVKEEEKEEKEEGVKLEMTTPIHAEDRKVEERKEEKNPDHPSTTTTQSTTEGKKKSAETTTEAVKEEVKEHKGEKVEIPAASEPKKDDHHSSSTVEKKQEDRHRTVKKDLGSPVKIPAEQKDDEVKIAKAGGLPSFISFSKDKQEHHSVKKDLTAHHEPEPKEMQARDTTTTSLPHSAKAKYTDEFLREVRCVTVETRDFFGSSESPFVPHLKGLCFVGPVLVVICIYLVCTVLRTRLSNEAPTEFFDMLGCGFHFGMWLVVDLSLYFIYDHWAQNWNATSGDTFAPEYPNPWKNLIFVSAFMMAVCTVEMWFHKYLHYDLTYERSYRCYEVIEPEPSSNNEEHFARRTNVD